MKQELRDDLKRKRSTSGSHHHINKKSKTTEPEVKTFDDNENANNTATN